MYRKPIPKPTSRPWVKYNCQIQIAKEAPINPAVWKAIPIDMVRCLPYLRVEIVTTGETIMAMEKLKPPMKAKSIEDAFGKTLSVR